MTNTKSYKKSLYIDQVRAEGISRRYVCSECFGELKIDIDPDNRNQRILYCFDCQEDTKGFVSRTTVEMRIAAAKEELYEVKANYPELAPREVNKSADQMISEMGF